MVVHFLNEHKAALCGRDDVRRTTEDPAAVTCKRCRTRVETYLRTHKLMEQARATVKTGLCPECGAELRRNLALPGWWQCGRFGEPSFRVEKYRNDRKCSFQTFTE